MKLPALGVKGYAIVAASAVAAVVLYVAYKRGKELAGAIATTASTTLNPASSENFVYKGLSSLIGSESTDSLGVSLWNFMNDNGGKNTTLSKQPPYELTPGSVADRAWTQEYGTTKDSPYPLAPGSVAERAWQSKYKSDPNLGK